ncbi:MAG: cupin domain-containing protein [Ruminococcaceae bacterium]|nr:cupin domain-containing protein [Oscillospiraceae bacterium]
MKYGVEVYDYKGEEYKIAMSYGKWRVAYLNHADTFVEENFEKIERHNETDEVFVLLKGSAVLIIGEELNRVEMEPHKIYNVPKGVWHHIFTKEGTSVLIIENEDTGDKNSDYLYIK